MRRVRLAQKNIRKYASRYPLCKALGKAVVSEECDISWTKTKRLSCLSPLDSPYIRRFFLNLSDSFSFALLSSDAVSLCFRFRSLASLVQTLSSMISLGLLLLNFGSRTIFFTRWSLPGRTSTSPSLAGQTLSRVRVWPARLYLSISVLARSFSHVDRFLVGPVPQALHFGSRTIFFPHTLIASWSDEYHVASSIDNITLR